MATPIVLAEVMALAWRWREFVTQTPLNNLPCHKQGALLQARKFLIYFVPPPFPPLNSIFARSHNTSLEINFVHIYPKFATVLIIMGSSQDGSSPRESIMLPLLTSLTKPSVQSRRIPCTHLQLTRLYGMHRCSHCFQTPMLGWVYRCVQDHHGELPLWENGCGNWSMVSQHETFLWDSVKEPDPHLNLSQLSPWIEQAIIDGHYTTAQVAVLKVQRERVVQSISIQPFVIAKTGELPRGSAV